MSKRNEAPVLILALLITLGLLGVGGWWLSKQLGLGNFASNSTAPSASSNSGAQEAGGAEIGISENGAQGQSGESAARAERISFGSQSLFAETAVPQKQQAIAAFQSGDFAAAASAFESYLQQNRNDPEALIYLSNARRAQQQAYTLAVAAPTQVAANPAKEILRGVAHAQRDINQQGGINGTPLRVAIANDDNDPQVARTIAEILVNDESILGVIGHFGSETTLAASTVYQQGQLPVMSPTSTSVEISEAGDSVFRTVPSDRFTATALSRHLVNDLNLQQAIVYFNGESSYSLSLKDEFTTALYADGGQIVSEVDVTRSGFNAAASLSQAQQQGAEAIVLLTNTATLDQALEIIKANSGQLKLLGGDSLYNPQILEVAGAAAEGMDVAVPWILLADPQSSFAQSSRQLWGGDVNWRTAMAYDAVIAFAEAIRRSPTRSGIQQALSQSGFEASGATGSVKFLPSGDRNQAMQLVTVAPGNRSGYGYDFVPANDEE